MSESRSVVSDSLQHVQLFASCLTLWDCIVHGILQARILDWVAFPFSRGPAQHRDRTQDSHIAGRFFTSWATREAPKPIPSAKDLPDLRIEPGSPAGRFFASWATRELPMPQLKVLNATTKFEDPACHIWDLAQPNKQILKINFKIKILFEKTEEWISKWWYIYTTEWISCCSREQHEWTSQYAEWSLSQKNK